jgi:Tfp pilus assembly protein PilW
MITTTHSQSRPDRKKRAARGFTIIEMMVGATLSTIILAGTMTTFLFLGRSGANLRNYSDMEAQARKSLEIFAEDTRQASSVTWTTSESVTLVVNAANIYYAYAAGKFTRKTDLTTATLLTGITSFSFSAYDINGTAITDFSTAAARTTANNSTKQVQISLSAARSTQTVTTATNIVLSARYVLRNKKVTA